jgi:hypothetical protein
MPNIDWSKLFTLKYWLEGTTASDTVNLLPVSQGSFFFYFYLSFFGGLIILSILMLLLKLFIHPQHPLQDKFALLSGNFTWIGILGLGWFTLRQIQVSFLSARLWVFFGAIWFLAIAIYFVRYYFVFYKLEMNYFKTKILKKD